VALSDETAVAHFQVGDKLYTVTGYLRDVRFESDPAYVETYSGRSYALPTAKRMRFKLEIDSESLVEREVGVPSDRPVPGFLDAEVRSAYDRGWRDALASIFREVGD
jgi:hypothetical protein